MKFKSSGGLPLGVNPVRNKFLIGVDLIELEKAKSFYLTHRKNLNSFLTSNEISYIQKGKKQHERLAILLAAKESVFKALGVGFMGINGFSDIQIIPKEKGNIFFRLKGKFRKAGRFPFNPRLSFFKKKGYVVVQCAGIS